MDATERTRLRALYEGIGMPWKAQPTIVDGDEIECSALVLCRDSEGEWHDVAEIDMGHGEECDDQHAALIVGAVNALPALLDALDAARAEVARLTRLRAHDVESVRQLRADCERLAGDCDVATAERDDARAEVETRNAENDLLREQLAAHARHTDAAVDGVRAMLPAALATARREGAEAMRERAAQQAGQRRSETGDDIADEIRALPLDAPGAA
jgi:hypothetical protein